MNPNYTATITWNPSSVPGAKYDIYRSTFDHQNVKTLIASDVTSTENNINYTIAIPNNGTVYVYYLKATRVFNGTKVESEINQGVKASIIPPAEIVKRVGKKSYDVFAEFNTGSGNGYINPAFRQSALPVHRSIHSVPNGYHFV